MGPIAPEQCPAGVVYAEWSKQLASAVGVQTSQCLDQPCGTQERLGYRTEAQRLHKIPLRGKTNGSWQS